MFGRDLLGPSLLAPCRALAWYAAGKFTMGDGAVRQLSMTGLTAGEPATTSTPCRLDAAPSR